MVCYGHSHCVIMLSRVRTEACRALHRQLLQPAVRRRTSRRSTRPCSRGTKRPGGADSTWCWRSDSRIRLTMWSSSWTDAGWSSRRRTSTRTKRDRPRLRCSAISTCRRTSTCRAFVQYCRPTDNLPSPPSSSDSRRGRLRKLPSVNGCCRSVEKSPERVLIGSKEKQVVKGFWWKAASHVVTLLRTERPLLLRTPQQRLPMLSSGPDTPKFPLSRRIWRELYSSTPLSVRDPSNSGFLGASQPPKTKRHLDRLGHFCRAYRVTNTQTDTETTLRATSVAVGRIFCTACMRCGHKRF